MEDGQIDLFAGSTNKDSIKKEIEELREKINYNNIKYYEEDNPEISDFEYDKLTQRLKKLEKENPEFVTKDSPTQKVGGRTKKIFSQVTHEVQMQSLQDVFSYDDVSSFVDKVKEEYGENIEPRTIRRDINLLKEKFGYDISTYNDNNIGYYITNDPETDFEPGEIRAIIEQSLAKGIIKKCRNLQNVYENEKIKNYKVYSPKGKTSNIEVIKNIEDIAKQKNCTKKSPFSRPVKTVTN